MGRFLAYLICLGSASLASAQDVEVEIPLTAPLDFSAVVGKKFDIATSAAPTQVFVEEPITLTVTIADCAHFLMPGSDYHAALLGALPPLLRAEWAEIQHSGSGRAHPSHERRTRRTSSNG